MCAFVNRFRYIKMGDKEVEYHPEFRLILHTKLANPHYKPEMQAQTTLINFTVTREGLEDQLLADVVRKERPDLEETKVLIVSLVTYMGNGSCNCTPFRLPIAQFHTKAILLSETDCLKVITCLI